MRGYVLRLLVQWDEARRAGAVARVVLLLLMAQYLDALLLFPLVFASLVLQKTYVVSKSALVPSTVRSEDELVEGTNPLWWSRHLNVYVRSDLLSPPDGPSAAVLKSLSFKEFSKR